MMIKVYQGSDLRAFAGQPLPQLGEPARVIAQAEVADYAFSRAVLKIFERYLRRN
jgi:hypothetical protein